MPRHAPWRQLGRSFLMVWPLLMNSAAAAQELKTTNTSRYLGNDRWSWTIFLTGPDEELNQVRCVEYTLHETFPDPVQVVCELGDRHQAFKLSAEGWGVFEVKIKVILKNEHSLSLRHMLRFAAPRESPDVRPGNSSRQVRKGWWEWTIFVQGPEETLRQIRCVRYRLHPTFPKPVQTVCNRGSGLQAFPLSGSGWGTFEVRIRLLMRDGTTSELTHQLQFTPQAGTGTSAVPATVTMLPDRCVPYVSAPSRRAGS